MPYKINVRKNSVEGFVLNKIISSVPFLNALFRINFLKSKLIRLVGFLSSNNFSFNDQKHRCCAENIGALSMLVDFFWTVGQIRIIKN